MNDFITIDFETACADMNSACAVGIVAVRGNNIVDSYYSLIKAESFSRENIAVHGITPDAVNDAPAFSDVLPVILSYIEQSRFVIAHNAQFDMSVLRQSADVVIDDFPYIDSVNYTVAAHGDHGHSLRACADYFGIKLLEHHNALADAECCAKIIIEATKAHESFYDYIQQENVRIKSFSSMASNKKMPSRGKSRKIPTYVWKEKKEMIADPSKLDPSHPLFGMNCVFTGDMENVSRNEALQLVIDVGGIIKSSVSKKIDYIIVGKQDPAVVGADGISSKERKAYQLIEQGTPIKVLHEAEFLEMFGMCQ